MMALFRSTPGLQPETVPSAVLNRKTLEPVLPSSSVTLKPVPLPLKTMPVGESRKMAGPGLGGTSTTNGLIATVGAEVSYRVLVPVPWLATHQGPVALGARPQGLTKFESSTCAGVTLVSSDTRLVCRMTDDNRRRCSNDSSRGRSGWRADAGAGRSAGGAGRFSFRRREESSMILFLSKAGPRVDET